MVNKMFGVSGIKGEVGYADGWLDGKPSAVIDYRRTSLVWGKSRDEIREVAPGLYLGIMFKAGCEPTIQSFFALDARAGKSCRCGDR